MSQENNIEVPYSSLVYGHNYVDQTFRAHVEKWMKLWMPGMPLDLLDTEDVEKWEMFYPARFEKRALDITTWTCSECGDEHRSVNGKCPVDLCCSIEGADDLATPAPLTPVDEEMYAIWDKEEQEWIMPERGDGSDYAIPFALWILESDADERVEELTRETEDEGRYGFPWAHNWFFLPDPYIPDSCLHDAGFTIGTYNGYRLCGIDGGGYSFNTVHYAKLVALLSEARNMTVETDQGWVRVTLDERTPAEKLASITPVEEEQE
jgi:hypothetical protein